MTNISNPFSLDCRQLPQKYTISTLYSANIADNQDSYGYIWEFSRFSLIVIGLLQAFENFTVSFKNVVKID